LSERPEILAEYHRLLSLLLGGQELLELAYKIDTLGKPLRTSDLQNKNP
jgi:hypothetical protein